MRRLVYNIINLTTIKGYDLHIYVYSYPFSFWNASVFSMIFKISVYNNVDSISASSKRDSYLD